MSSLPHIVVRHLGQQPYQQMWQKMKAFVTDRDPSMPGEIWLTEHPPVFTLGSNAKQEHVLAAGDIPVVPVDRGGQVTYHGPGQLMIYPLIHLTKTHLGVRDLVTGLENSVVDTLAAHNIEAYPRRDAPGVYVDGCKIASIGLRIKRHWSYHGMAFNINMDLEPFSRINPCGFAGLEITDFARLGGPQSLESVSPEFIPHLLRHLGYDCDPLDE